MSLNYYDYYYYCCYYFHHHIIIVITNSQLKAKPCTNKPSTLCFVTVLNITIIMTFNKSWYKPPVQCIKMYID